jgi:hypothetical protein
MTTEASIRDIVSEVLQSRFASRGFVSFDIAFDEDFDGDTTVRVTAHFDRREDVGQALFDAADAIRARMIARGDNRFVFVTSDYPGARDELAAESETERTRAS